MIVTYECTAHLRCTRPKPIFVYSRSKRQCFEHAIVCFVAGTLIATAVGYIAIEAIEAGDLVWATNPETGETELKKVVRLFRNETKEWVHITVNGEDITCTPTHPFYVPQKGWTNAIDLRAGDILVMLNGQYVVIEQVQHELLESPETTYNFEVEDFHTYYVGDTSVFVHNKCNGNWSKGSFDSPQESATYHFLEHGRSVGANDINQYTNKATSFANQVLTKRVKRTLVNGFTSNVYRYRNAGKYVDLYFDGFEHLIVSFGV